METEEKVTSYRLTKTKDNIIISCIIVAILAVISSYLLLSVKGLYNVICGYICIFTALVFVFLSIDFSGYQLVVSTDGLKFQTKFRKFKKIIIPVSTDGNINGDIEIIEQLTDLSPDVKSYPRRINPTSAVKGLFCRHSRSIGL